MVFYGSLFWFSSPKPSIPRLHGLQQLAPQQLRSRQGQKGIGLGAGVSCCVQGLAEAGVHGMSETTHENF